jgi:nitrate/nitrite transporter NarK
MKRFYLKPKSLENAEVNMFLVLLAAAGITFALQHKIPAIHKKHPFLDAMLKCTYCTGFHGGWIAYTIQSLFEWSFQEALLFAFAGAIFSYALDEIVKFFEEFDHGADSD